MLNDLVYHLIVSILEIFMWDGELIGGEIFKMDQPLL